MNPEFHYIPTRHLVPNPTLNTSPSFLTNLPIKWITIQTHWYFVRWVGAYGGSAILNVRKFTARIFHRYSKAIIFVQNLVIINIVILIQKFQIYVNFFWKHELGWWELNYVILLIYEAGALKVIVEWNLLFPELPSAWKNKQSLVNDLEIHLMSL